MKKHFGWLLFRQEVFYGDAVALVGANARAVFAEVKALLVVFAHYPAQIFTGILLLLFCIDCREQLFYITPTLNIQLEAECTGIVA